MKSMVQQILGCQLPHPEVDFYMFSNVLRKALEKEGRAVFDPIRNSFQPWVDLVELAKKYNSSPKSAACCLS